MSLGEFTGITSAIDGRTELETLLGYTGSDDRDALMQFFDLTYPTVSQWLQAGIAVGPRHDLLITSIYAEVWARAAYFRPGSTGVFHWLSEIVRDVLRRAEAPA